MIRNPRIGHSLSKTDQAKLKHGLSVLKSSGLIPNTKQRVYRGIGARGKDISAIDLVNQYQNVINNRASVIDTSKLSDSEKTQYKKLYPNAQGGKLIVVEHSPDETVKVQGGKIVLTHPAGIERIQIPVKFHNLESYLAEIKSSIPEMEKQRHGRAMFAFRYFGNSSKPYNTLDALFSDLSHYTSLQDSITRGDTKLQREIFRNLEIVIVKSSSFWYAQKKANMRKRFARKRKKK